MLSQKMEDAINDQIQAEFESANIYLSMAAYFENVDLPGFAGWMRIQFEEEQMHAMKFYDYVNERGGRIKLQALAGPPIEFDSALDVFKQTLAHEQKVTGLINNLYALAIEERDFACQIFLQWFVEEQVEEEKNANDIISLLKRIGDNEHALLMLDREMAQRQAPVAPDAEAA